MFEANKNKSDKIKYKFVNESIKLMEYIKVKEVSGNENQKKKKIANIVNEQEIGRGLKILTPEHILNRLPVAIAQVKAGKTSENLPNEIQQMIYSLY